MSKVLELREKRAKLWEQAKNLLDTAKRVDDVLTAEDEAEYEKMETDIVAMGREIEMLERQAALDLEMQKPTTSPITNKPSTGVDTKTGRASDDYKGAFWKTMHQRDTSPTVLNALQIGTESEGGYLVPEEYEAKLIESLKEENIIRSMATVVLSSGEKKIPVVASNGMANWTDEEGEILESDDSFGQISLGAHKLSSIIKVSEELLNDSAFNLEQYIAKEFTRRISTAEEAAFINGTGASRPTGLLQSGQIGVTAGSNVAITADEIIDLYHSLKAPYRKKAEFITNDMTVKTIRKLKDTTGQFMWQPGLQAGNPDTILNRPIKTSSHMPTIAAGAKLMIFGDISYYWIADRQGRVFQRLNELFAKNGQVGFKVTQRVDGKLTLPEAVKILQMKA